MRLNGIATNTKTTIVRRMIVVGCCRSLTDEINEKRNVGNF